MYKTTKFWLIISLCINLLFVGLFIGGAVHARKIVGDANTPPPNELNAFMRAMPADSREAWVGRFRRDARPEERRNIDDLASLIAADPFDAEAVRNYLDENRLVNDARIHQAQDQMLQSLSQMSDEERDEIAERMRKMPKRHPKRDDDDREHRD